jgi:hypothetical protein
VRLRDIRNYSAATCNRFYEVWTAGRPVVLGCSRTRERAQIEAAIA